MEHMTIYNARHLRFPNEFGMKKVMRNIMALQQSLRTLSIDQNETDFERAKRYYNLFSLSPRVSLRQLHFRASTHYPLGNAGQNQEAAATGV
jgi:exocyst complex component 4